MLTGILEVSQTETKVCLRVEQDRMLRGAVGVGLELT